MNVIVCRNLVEVAEHVSGWYSLFESVSHANIFYYPDFLLATIKSKIVGNDWQIIFIYEDSQLLAVLPISVYPPRGLWPFSHLGMLTHRYCFRCSPLCAHGKESTVVKEFYKYIGKRVFVFPLQYANEKFSQEIIRHIPLYTFEKFERPYVDISKGSLGGVQEYFNKRLDSSDRKKFRSREKKLSAAGNLELQQLDPDASPDKVAEWVEDFLKVEASGWKAETGTALSQTEVDQSFFIEICKALHERGMLVMRRLVLNGNTSIASSCCFTANHYEVTFKIAYNQAYAELSPGVMLEYISMQKLLENKTMIQRDSCTSTASRTHAKLWDARLDVESFIVVPSSFWKKCFFAVLVKIRDLRSRVVA